tara:strand:- start:3232 stop:3696 length:465 start_codon:yes stop_codon:yes gene_type:complete
MDKKGSGKMSTIKEHRERLDNLLKEARELEDEIEAMSNLKQCWELNDHAWEVVVDGNFDTTERVIMKCSRCGLLHDIHIKKTEQALELDGKKLSKIGDGFAAEEEEEKDRYHVPNEIDGAPTHPYPNPYSDRDNVYRLDSNSVLAHRLSRIGDN